MGERGRGAVRQAAGRGSADGWLFADRWSYAGGPIYATAFAVLTLLEAY